VKRLRRRQDITVKRAMMFLMTIIFATVISVVFSVSAFLQVYGIKAQQKKSAEMYKTYISQQLEGIKDDVEKLKTIVGPGGIVERYLTKMNYLENMLQDFQRVITEMQEERMSGYFQIFITGKDEVWVGVKRSTKDSVYVFSKNLKPGLAPYKFYFFKTPVIKTDYMIPISPDCVIESASPDKTVLLLYNQGVSKAVTMKTKKVEGLAKTYGLYIPKGGGS